MNKKIFLIGTILLTFTAISCKQSNQKTANSVPVTNVVAEKENVVENKTKLSDKFKGVFTKEEAESFNKHTQTIRKEWIIIN